MATPTRQRRPQPATPPTAVAVRDPQRDALEALASELDRRASVIATSAAAGITPERLRGVALSAFTRNPDLWNCTPVSVARAIVEAAQLGLEPTGLMGGAYLVPYRGECQLLIGYRGLVILARRSGEVARVEAHVVHANDSLAYEFGLAPRLQHVPALAGDPGRVTHAYAVAFFRDGGTQYDLMGADDIDAIRQRSRARDAGPWVTDYEEMAKKTVLRRLCKLLPLTVEVQSALDTLDPEVAPAPVALAGGRGGVTLARQAVQQQLAAHAAPANVEHALVDDVPPDPVPVSAQAAACGAPAPEDGGTSCTLPRDHPGAHDSPWGRWPA